MFYLKIIDYSSKMSSGVHLTANAFVPNYFLKDLTSPSYAGELDLGKVKTNLSLLNVFFQNISEDYQ